MAIGHVAEHVHLALVQHPVDIVGVDWRVAPALVEEATFAIQVVEVVDVGLRAEYGEGGHFEVVVEGAHARCERLAAVLRNKAHGIVGGRWMASTRAVEPVEHVRPKCGNGEVALGRAESKAVRLIVADERLERIVLDGTGKVRVVVDAHKVVVLARELVAKEEAGVEAAHVSIVEAEADGLEAPLESHLSHPLGHAPLRRRYESELHATLGGRAHTASKVGQERLVVKQHVRIVVLVVEVALESVDGVQ